MGAFWLDLEGVTPMEGGTVPALRGRGESLHPPSGRESGPKRGMLQGVREDAGGEPTEPERSRGDRPEASPEVRSPRPAHRGGASADQTDRPSVVWVDVGGGGGGEGERLSERRMSPGQVRQSLSAPVWQSHE
jgi:hypothetical protein